VLEGEPFGWQAGRAADHGRFAPGFSRQYANDWRVNFERKVATQPPWPRPAKRLAGPPPNLDGTIDFDGGSEVLV